MLMPPQQPCLGPSRTDLELVALSPRPANRQEWTKRARGECND
ncbi:hypothetical protein PC123_g25703 [Phytophthora cactorum]|nr:hypothetical protein PC123_g25703 [Phytophthora cactorum]